ncbi:precorrin-3B synthase [Roseomonas sp. OT10]|uniref:precorrin-3B synthase n=1 Tax=Roseomonas cutis TaxID=2897332 RepID=UPI001E613E95|nr:precorrin-3B synthase [Roseomonas sp. OT10]UFN47803.1 precorrin-3B synthase [Roseomonas sp. OT10]
MIPEGMIRGWCPSLFEPMASGDGLLLRVKPYGARLDAGAARAVGAAAARHGNGWIDLTQRGNLQIRGVTPEGVEPFAAAMRAAGLASASPDAERRRNLIAPPLLGTDPALEPGAEALATALEAMLEAADLPTLPGKIVLLLDAGGALPPDGVAADLRLTLRAGAVRLSLPGGTAAAECPAATAPAAAEAVLRAFLALGGGQGEARRLRGLVARVGAGALLRAAGLEPRADVPGSGAAERPPPIGPHLLAGGIAFGLAPPFGQFSALQLGTLAGLAERLGDGTLRTTPWRTLLLPGVAPRDGLALRDVVLAAGLIADPGDGRLNLVTCPGRPACPRAGVATHRDADWLATRPLPGLLHLSGCAKGCAHPAPAPFTLVGTPGGYALVRGGRAGDRPEAVGLTPEQAATLLAAGGTGAAATRSG